MLYSCKIVKTTIGVKKLVAVVFGFKQNQNSWEFNRGTILQFV